MLSEVLSDPSEVLSIPADGADPFDAVRRTLSLSPRGRLRAGRRSRPQSLRTRAGRGVASRRAPRMARGARGSPPRLRPTRRGRRCDGRPSLDLRATRWAILAQVPVGAREKQRVRTVDSTHETSASRRELGGSRGIDLTPAHARLATTPVKPEKALGKCAQIRKNNPGAPSGLADAIPGLMTLESNSSRQ